MTNTIEAEDDVSRTSTGVLNQYAFVLEGLRAVYDRLSEPGISPGEAAGLVADMRRTIEQASLIAGAYAEAGWTTSDTLPLRAFVAAAEKN